MLWITWRNISINNNTARISGTSACKFQGEERTLIEKRGVDFGGIVKTLMTILRSGKAGEEYLEDVKLKL